MEKSYLQSADISPQQKPQSSHYEVEAPVIDYAPFDLCVGLILCDVVITIKPLI